MFDELIALDCTGASWLPRLLSLAAHGRREVSRRDVGVLEKWGWGDAEVGLPAPRTLLRWLVANLAPDLAHKNCDPASTSGRKRLALASQDADVIAEALALLDQPRIPGRIWYVLEGASFPDVYLETCRALVVIEGKRTEPSATTSTTWMPVRDQMLRHLDCAWDRRGDRDLFGLFIVEGGDGGESVAVPEDWLAAARQTIEATVLAQSLPHRTPDEREQIAETFAGVTTWQRVCAEFNIPWRALPDKIGERPSQ